MDEVSIGMKSRLLQMLVAWSRSQDYARTFFSAAVDILAA